MSAVQPQDLRLRLRSTAYSLRLFSLQAVDIGGVFWEHDSSDFVHIFPSRLRRHLH